MEELLYQEKDPIVDFIPEHVYKFLENRNKIGTIKDEIIFTYKPISSVRLLQNNKIYAPRFWRENVS